MIDSKWASTEKFDPQGRCVGQVEQAEALYGAVGEGGLSPQECLGLANRIHALELLTPVLRVTLSCQGFLSKAFANNVKTIPVYHTMQR